jgi:hypothetical protein
MRWLGSQAKFLGLSLWLTDTATMTDFCLFPSAITSLPYSCEKNLSRRFLDRPRVRNVGVRPFYRLRLPPKDTLSRMLVLCSEHVTGIVAAAVRLRAIIHVTDNMVFRAAKPCTGRQDVEGEKVCRLSAPNQAVSFPICEEIVKSLSVPDSLCCLPVSDHFRSFNRLRAYGPFPG